MDLSALWQRIAHPALVVVGAANEALGRFFTLVGDKIAMAALSLALRALPHDHVWLAVGLAHGVHAQLIGLGAKRLALDARRPTRRAHTRLSLDWLHLHVGRHGVGDVAVGPAHAADEAAACLGRALHHEVLATARTASYLGVCRDRVGDGLA